MLCQTCKDKLEITRHKFTKAKYSEEQVEKIILAEYKKHMEHKINKDVAGLIKRLDRRFETLKREVASDFLRKELTGAIDEMRDTAK